MSESGADATSAVRFVQNCQSIGDYSDEPVECRKEMVRHCLENYLTREEKSEDNLSGLLASPEKLAQASGFEGLVGLLESTVINQKAMSILVNEGVVPVENILTSFEADLERKEKLASVSAQEFQDKVAGETRILEEFNTQSMKDISQIMSEPDREPLANDFLNSVIIANIGSLADAVSDKVAENILQFKNLLKAFNKDALKEKLLPLINDATQEILQPAISGWITNVCDGFNKAYQGSIKRDFDQIVKELQEKWQKIAAVDGALLLGGLDGFLCEVQEIIAQAGAAPKVNVDKIAKDAFTVNIKLLAVNLAMIPAGLLAGGIGINIALAVALPLITAAPIILPIIAIAAILGTGKILGTVKNKVKNAFKHEIHNSIMEAFNQNENKEQILSAGREIAQKIQENAREQLSDMLTRQKEAFEQNKAQAESDFAQAQAVREQVAAECRTLRETHIVPNREWCETFEQEVVAQL